MKYNYKYIDKEEKIDISWEYNIICHIQFITNKLCHCQKKRSIPVFQFTFSTHF